MNRKLRAIALSLALLTVISAQAQDTAVAAEEKATAETGEQEVAAEQKSNASQADNEKQEIIVNADTMEMHLDEHIVNLDGNVLVEDAEMVLSAKKMIVHLDNDNKLRDIEAMGDVRVRKLDNSESATGDTGFYDAGADMVTLKGKCVILKDKNTIKGETVIYNRKTGTIKLKGGSISIPLKKGSSGGGLDGILNKKDKASKAKQEQPKTEAKPDEGAATVK